MILENEILYAAMEWMLAVVKSREGHIAIERKGIKASAKKFLDTKIVNIVNLHVLIDAIGTQADIVERIP